VVRHSGSADRRASQPTAHRPATSAVQSSLPYNNHRGQDPLKKFFVQYKSATGDPRQHHCNAQHANCQSSAEMPRPSATQDENPVSLSGLLTPCTSATANDLSTAPSSSDRQARGVLPAFGGHAPALRSTPHEFDLGDERTRATP
jgi:hypothetical protein